MSVPGSGGQELDPRRIPRHVAIVMDGNGRWARAKGLPRTKGHEAGERALWDVLQGALEIGISHLTVYAFSTENWTRPRPEVSFLMSFNRALIRKRRDALHEQGVRILFMGRRDWRLPRSVAREMEAAEAMTRANDRMTLIVALNYGGRTEIVDAARKLLEDQAAGKLRGERVDSRSLSRRMYHPGVPDPDLVIRTSGEMRLSNFLVWQSAYAELWFTDVLWPDFSRDHLREAVRDYQRRDRRYGGVGK